MQWSGTVRALSSVAHGGEQRGTIMALRRETVIQPDGRAVLVPIISGNSWRGRLRRIGEELLRDALGYEGELELAAAHALRGGGSLARTSAEPLSGRRLQELRLLIPQVGVFGCAAGGRIIDGCLRVGKVVPQIAETAHILAGPASEMPWIRATQLETYLRQDDTNQHAFADLVGVVPVDVDESGAPLFDAVEAGAGTERMLMFRVETFPAGTTFETWLRLDRATPREVAFFADVLAQFSAEGRLGGRVGIGHGQVALNLEQRRVAGVEPTPVDWRRELVEHRDQAMNVLRYLT